MRELIWVWEARSIVSWLDFGAITASVWRLAEGEDGSDRKAAGGIDLIHGKVWLQSWSVDREMPSDPNIPVLVLAYCDTQQREKTWRRLSRGLEVPPSEDVVFEEVQERARREGVDWRHVELQLERIYGESQAA